MSDEGEGEEEGNGVVLTDPGSDCHGCRSAAPLHPPEAAEHEATWLPGERRAPGERKHSPPERGREGGERRGRREGVNTEKVE